MGASLDGLACGFRVGKIKPTQASYATGVERLVTTLSIEQAKKEKKWLECHCTIERVRALGGDPDQGQGEPTVRPRGHRKRNAPKGGCGGGEALSKVERGKRKAVLHRERDALATKVRNGLAKVSSVSSPFKK